MNKKQKILLTLIFLVAIILLLLFVRENTKKVSMEIETKQDTKQEITISKNETEKDNESVTEKKQEIKETSNKLLTKKDFINLVENTDNNNPDEVERLNYELTKIGKATLSTNPKIKKEAKMLLDTYSNFREGKALANIKTESDKSTQNNQKTN